MSKVFENWINYGSSSTSFYGNIWIGDTFTVGRWGLNKKHEVKSIKLLICKGPWMNPTGNIDIIICSLDSNDKPLATLSSGVVDAATLPAHNEHTWVDVAMSSTILYPDLRYGFYIKHLTGEAGNDAMWRHKSQASPELYLRTTDAGVNWTTDSAKTGTFQIMGEDTLIVIRRDGTTSEGEGGYATRAVNKNYPATAGLIAGTTKQAGRDPTLRPTKGSLIYRRNKALI